MSCSKDICGTDQAATTEEGASRSSNEHTHLVRMLMGGGFLSSYDPADRASNTSETGNIGLPHANGRPVHIVEGTIGLF